MIGSLDTVIPALVLGLPLFGALAELASSGKDGQGRAGLRRVLVAAYLANLLLGAAWPLLVEDRGLAILEWNWAPGLDFVLSWQFSPVHLALLALSCAAWSSALRDASPRQAFAACGMQLSLGLVVGAADLLSAGSGMLLLATWGLFAARGQGAGESHGFVQGERMELALAAAAGLSLCVSVGLATHVATHDAWHYAWIELESVTFPPGVQEQSLVLALVCVAPFVGLLPFGGASLRIGESLGALGVQWRSAAPLAGAALWSQALRSLAPRTGADWAEGLLGLFVLSALIRVWIARGRWARRSEASKDPVVGDVAGQAVWGPLLLGGGVLAIGSEWGSYALWLAMAAHLCHQALETRASTFSRYLRSGAPGSVLFAALVASWVAMHEAVALLHPAAAMLLGAGLCWPVVASWPLVFAPRPAGEEAAPRPAWRAMAASALVIGIFPMTIVKSLAPLEATRASEYLLLRCGDLELADLRRPRLRAELRLGCSDPAAELELAFNPDDPKASPALPTIAPEEFFSSLPEEESP